jgi:hypothetical protein
MRHYVVPAIAHPGGSARVAILSHQPATFMTGSNPTAPACSATRAVVLGCLSYAPATPARRAFQNRDSPHLNREKEGQSPCFGRLTVGVRVAPRGYAPSGYWWVGRDNATLTESTPGHRKCLTVAIATRSAGLW